MANVTSKAVKLGLLCLLTALALVSATPTWVVAASPKKKLNTNWQGIAIKGYDTVAYFTEGRAVQGKKEYEYEWQGAKWRFASAANRDKFAANPPAYAPKYGGF